MTPNFTGQVFSSYCQLFSVPRFPLLGFRRQNFRCLCVRVIANKDFSAAPKQQFG